MDGGKLHGTVKKSGGRNGGVIETPFGRDDSDVTPSKKMSREGSEGFGGGMRDVSHSLSNVSANQDAD